MWSVADQCPGFRFDQVTGREQGGHLDGCAGGRPASVNDGVAGDPYRGQVRDVEHEERQLHHVAEIGPNRGQAAAEVLEHLPRLSGGITGPDQFTALVLSDLAAHHDQPAAAVTT